MPTDLSEDTLDTATRPREPVDERVPEDLDPVPEPGARDRSLLDDIDALLQDARLYVSAELSFQKTRAAFVANSLKKTIAFGAVAAFLAVLATIGLTVGLIIALTPIITAWGATAVVVLGLLLLAYLLVRKAADTWSRMTQVMAEKDEEDSADG